MSRWPLRKTMFLLYALFVLGILGGYVLSELIDQRIVWFAWPIAIVSAIRLALLRCERCERYIFHRERKIGRSRFSSWGGLPPRRCPHCGWELTKTFVEVP